MNVKQLLMLVVVMCMTSVAKAQFYDSADDIYYYVECDDKSIPYKNGGVCIWNFDGLYAFRIFCNVPGPGSGGVTMVKEKLKSNPIFFEECVETGEYDFKYVKSYNGVQYERTRYQNLGAHIVNCKYTFSPDRSLMTAFEHNEVYYSPNDVRKYDTIIKYVKVDKSFFKVGRSRTPSSTLHE